MKDGERRGRVCYNYKISFIIQLFLISYIIIIIRTNGCQGEQVIERTGIRANGTGTIYVYTITGQRPIVAIFYLFLRDYFYIVQYIRLNVALNGLILIEIKKK